MDRSIVFVLSWGLSGVSGVVSWVETLREELRARGVRVGILLGRPSPDSSEWGDVDAIFHTPEDLERILPDYSPGVVVVMNKQRHLPFGSLTEQLNRDGRRLHLVSVLHSDTFDEYYRHVEAFQPFTHHFISVSPTVHRNTRNELARLGSDHRDHCSLLPYGVRLPEARPRRYQAAPIRLAYAGRMVQHQKRIFDFVPLVERLVARGVDFELSLAGHGAHEAELRERISRLGQGAGRVRFLGRIPHRKMLEGWHEFDAFVNLSSFEGTSVAMLEAMAAGCVPVVTAASSGVCETLDYGRNGLFAPVGDMDGMAAHIASLQASPNRLAALGRAARATVERSYTLSDHGERFLEIVNRVASSSPVRGERPRPSVEAGVALGA
ncbi:MAG: glycosyltransferase family 4 protein [Deltaproteobacteria bacterium]|nr:glycosyltransferase family 4 protein [Deltaproteobacteria bacterium]MBW2446930.1 glycosyltransferase family 4 protein [Deltaproteobacteria bacterium]